MKKTNNKLIKVVSPIKGSHHFTNRFKAATWVGLASSAVSACLAGSVRKDGITFELVDGSEVKWKDID